MKKILQFSILASVSLLSACDYASSHYPKVGSPENLIDVSSEKVTFGLNGRGSLSRLSSMVEQDKPSEVELNCSLQHAFCTQAKEIFERKHVPIVFGNSNSNNVIMSYERVVVRDCDPRYVDNMSGSRSYNHPAFGCASAANIVQMVSDRKQFTNPNLMDLPDAEKANQSYSGYLKPSPLREVKEAEWSTGSSK